MNDFDLESKIRSIRAPKRGDEYWEAFPDQVLAELRTHSPAMVEHRNWTGTCFLLGRIAMACLAVVFCLWQTPLPREFTHLLRKDETQLRQSMRQFERNLDRAMQDEHGLHHLVEDQS
jgi:hypothetical protein